MKSYIEGFQEKNIRIKIFINDRDTMAFTNKGNKEKILIKKFYGKIAKAVFIRSKM